MTRIPLAQNKWKEDVQISDAKNQRSIFSILIPNSHCGGQLQLPGHGVFGQEPGRPCSDVQPATSSNWGAVAVSRTEKSDRFRVRDSVHDRLASIFLKESDMNQY